MKTRENNSTSLLFISAAAESARSASLRTNFNLEQAKNANLVQYSQNETDILLELERDWGSKAQFSSAQLTRISQLIQKAPVR